MRRKDGGARAGQAAEDRGAQEHLEGSLALEFRVRPFVATRVATYFRRRFLRSRLNLLQQETDENLTVCEEILATYIKKRLKVRAK